MKRTWKQIGSLILALCMLLAMLPAVALAEGSGTVTGQLTIGGVTVVSDLTEDRSGTGWEWDASTATLKLGSSYPEGNGIVISSQAGEIINLELSGDVKITPATGRALSIINGGLTIKANSYTLTAVSSEVSTPSIVAEGNVVIESGTIVAQASNGGSAITASGNITVRGNAHITATAVQGNGINASGTITIEGGNVLTEGWRGVSSIKSLVISDGSLTVTGVGTDSRAIYTTMGTNITGGTLTTNNNDGKNGDVNSKLTVSGETTVVTVNGTVSGDLTVSGGSVAVSGSVSGTTTHTGGTLNGVTVGGNTFTFSGSGDRIYGNDNGVSSSVAPNAYSNDAGGTSDNNVTIAATATISGGVIGGHAAGSGVNAANNTVTINGANLGVKSIYGGYARAGSAQGNKVYITNGTSAYGVYGGAAFSNAFSASGNEVHMNGGTVTELVGGSGNSHAAATGNQVYLSGGTVGRVVGGRINNDIGTATGNTVTISGSPSISEAIKGGDDFSVLGVDVRTGNTLNLQTAITAYGAENFENWNFKLPASATDGSTMLTHSDDWMSTDLGTAAVVSIDASSLISPLSEGDAITLIDASAGTLTGTLANTTITNSGYTFNLTISGNKLIATVPVPSSNANLASLTVSAGTLSPAFDPGTTSYSVSVANSVSSITAGATAAEAGATVTGTGAKALSVGANTITITVTAGDGVTTKTYTITVTRAAYSGGGDTGGGGGGDTGGGGGGSSVVTPPAEQPKTETTTSGNTATATTTATAAVNSSGTATASVTQAQVSDAIAKAAEAAAKQGNGAAAVVEIKVTAPAEAKTVETSIPKAAMELVADGKTAALTVSTPIASLNFDAAALSTIAGKAAGDVNISASIVDASTLSAATQQLIGDRPVFNFSVTSGGQTISQFGGSVAVSVPYTPKAGEDLNAIVIYYINAEGKPEVVSNCSYDPATGTISFKTNHFSQYAVGYNKVTFKDVAESAWYSKAVGFIAARGVTTGTGNGNYSPDAKLTRGEFIVMMMKAYGIAPDTATADNFTDAGNTYYTGYLAAAKHFGIAGGVGNNKFAPEKAITRQEMFTMLYNALKALNKLPAGNSGKNLTDFTDSAIVADWAAEAMTELVKSGTVTGSGGKLDPTGGSTRAQMAQVLYNLLVK